MRNDTALLSVRGATKRYGGLTAVGDISFDVHSGDIFGIAGPNGAGKTTLFDIVTGLVRLSNGEVIFAGTPIGGASVHQICHRGIARTFQHTAVFDNATVMANVMVGAHFGSGTSWWRSLKRDPAVWNRCLNALELTGLTDRAHELAGTLTVLDKKHLMIASALATSPRMLFLDEPFGGLNDDEIDALLTMLQHLNTSQGITLVLIEHVMRALTTLATSLLIMHQGRALRQGPPSEVMTDSEVVRVYLGSSATPGQLADPNHNAATVEANRAGQHHA